jgi:hypothetical protein
LFLLRATHLATSAYDVTVTTAIGGEATSNKPEDVAISFVTPIVPPLRWQQLQPDSELLLLADLRLSLDRLFGERFRGTIPPEHVNNSRHACGLLIIFLSLHHLIMTTLLLLLVRMPPAHVFVDKSARPARQ